MYTCDLDLGADPWERLAVGRVEGSLSWDGGPWLPVRAAIRGAHSRKFPKRSLQVTFLGDPLSDGPPAGHTVRQIHLNADYVDPTLMRSALSLRLFDTLGVPAPRSRHAVVIISGQFAGVYVVLESVDRDFCLRRGWMPGPIYYAINRNANFGLVSPFSRKLKEPLEAGYQPVEGARTLPLRRMLTDLNLASDRSFLTVAGRWIDVTGYLRWLMVAVFVGNRDGFVHNYALYQNPETERFCIIPWDYDATWGIDINGKPARLDRVPVAGWNKLSARLMEVPQVRDQYRRQFREALAGPLSPKRLAEAIDKMSADVGRWIDKDHREHGLSSNFLEETERLKDWAQARGALLSSQLDAF